MSLGLKIFIAFLGLWALAHMAAPKPTPQAAPKVRTMAEIEAEKSGKIDVSGLSDKAKRVKTKHPQWTNEVCEIVGKKQIQIGMTTEQVRASWGKPTNINTTTTANGEREQWVYGESRSDYVYFVDGVMTTLQQSK